MGGEMAQQTGAGCPFSERARNFDPFGPDYQEDPAEALRWSREEEPVFFSEVLNYWVVSRYDDIKAIFRDNITFSPSIVLEKITPPTPEFLAILQKYGFALNRTLVNEDEPVHTERRRALLDAFTPEALAAHEPMVRRLVRARVDAMIDRGEADLVEALLWEVPLTVALHFLGVPEEDMGKLKEFSVAHTLNTWGRPSPEEQAALAEGVGRFWAYSGEVLARMKQNPEGTGWMHDMIRRNIEMPEVVTDNYLHSMLMAIIVAAHETTAMSAAQAFRLLLSDREAWERLCREPELVPNAVEECLRLAGAAVAWRRRATRDVEVGGVTIPEGGKILIVLASGNHDPRHFEMPDRLDLYRENTADHLTFGYGSHQCMGKNLGRMEIRIMLEEITRRLPHLELVPGQRFTYLPNTTFRGPERVLVRWDPARNPERADPALRVLRRDFPIGPPSTRALSRAVTVAEVHRDAEGVLGLTLQAADGGSLPGWSPGAHIDILLPDGGARKYSLCGAPEEAGRYRISILLEPEGRGGSRWLHETAREGMTLRIRGPKNHFRLDETPPAHVLVAGGIGITPVLSMADRLKGQGRPYRLVYAGRRRARMAHLSRAMREHAGAFSAHVTDEGTRLDLAALVAGLAPGTLVCACGPERMLEALAAHMALRPDCRLSVEHFTSGAPVLERGQETPFEVELADSGITLPVPADRTLLEVLRGAGIDLPSDCEEGLCGSCELTLLGGQADHRDRVLSDAERREGRRIIACCSRAAGGGRLIVQA